MRGRERYCTLFKTCQIKYRRRSVIDYSLKSVDPSRSPSVRDRIEGWVQKVGERETGRVGWLSSYLFHALYILRSN